jgi:hypothetical protein
MISPEKYHIHGKIMEITGENIDFSTVANSWKFS